MHRRKLIQNLGLVGLAAVFPWDAWAQQGLRHPGSFSMDGQRVRLVHPGVKKAFKVTMLADTHLYLDDERGVPYQSYSHRMAQAYHHTKHFINGKDLNPVQAFEESLALAKEASSDLLALVGDILSFPSAAGVDWVLGKLKALDMPYVYTAGNHDWHFEGMEGSSMDLRSQWIQQRLLPFYQGRNPLMQALDLHGTKILIIDNSTYEILPEQLAFLESHLDQGLPSVLMLHIPLYAPGRTLGFGCGHPQWKAANDRNYQLERRQPWRKEGHTPTTMKFYDRVFQANNLLGVFAGHIHQPSMDIIQGIPQVVVEANAEGGYLQLEFSKQ